MDYKVLRPHLGDKQYLPGDVRSAKEVTVSHLVAKGVLAPLAQGEPAIETDLKAVTEPSGDGAGQQAAPESKVSEPPQNASHGSTPTEAAGKAKPKD
ncbi:hypothetical protein Q4598_04005 [Phaeobacter inhibens]|uniref:hypothetical protein n=1 Tax=Phaeobacter inhibens TaxID=221822 RepID=UPI0026E24A57|nr:hypothetical protein [Phaeobacter inhibens]MDO6755384.1 hypothetical protein [Phaeobacter inhibens]